VDSLAHAALSEAQEVFRSIHGVFDEARVILDLAALLHRKGERAGHTNRRACAHIDSCSTSIHFATAVMSFPHASSRTAR